MADYCTADDVAKVVTNIASWCSTVASKITLATEAINKYLRNSRDLDDDDIANLTTQSVEDLKTAAVYYVLFLAYNDASEGAAGGYADKAVDYKKWYDKEMSSVKLEIDSGGDGEGDQISEGPSMVSL